MPATSGIAGGAVSTLTDVFNQLSGAGAQSATPPFGGTVESTIEWLRDAINGGITNLNNASSAFGFPPQSPVTAVPLPTPRPADAPVDDLTKLRRAIDEMYHDSFASQIKRDYGDKCLPAPSDVETLPDNNASYNLQEFSRQSVLDVTIEALIQDGGLDATFATEYATGMYGIESLYGDSGQDHWSGTFVGPFQTYQPFINDYFTPKGQGSKKKIVDQIVSIRNMASRTLRNLQARFPGVTIEPADIYICHQQGGDGSFGGGLALLSADPDKAASSVVGSGAIQQTGYGKLYFADVTAGRFVQVQEEIFNYFVARKAQGDCGEFAVEFLAGDT